MAEKIEPKPKTGDRKRKGASEKPRKVMAFRVNDELNKRLEAASQARGFSLSEEIEARLTASFRSAADPYIGAAFAMAEANCDVVQKLLGKNIAEDPFTRAACAKAAATAIELVGGLASQDTPETRALLQTEAEAFGQLVGMFVQTVHDGVKNDFTETLGRVTEIVAARRRHAAEQENGPSPQLLARLLREGVPADPATPDEIAGMVPARGQLPPEIGDRALFDDAVSGLPLVQAEGAAEKPVEPRTAPTPKRRGRAKAPA